MSKNVLTSRAVKLKYKPIGLILSILSVLSLAIVTILSAPKGMPILLYPLVCLLVLTADKVSVSIIFSFVFIVLSFIVSTFEYRWIAKQGKSCPLAKAGLVVSALLVVGIGLYFFIFITFSGRLFSILDILRKII